jgi:formate transporter
MPGSRPPWIVRRAMSATTTDGRRGDDDAAPQREGAPSEAAAPPPSLDALLPAQMAAKAADVGAAKANMDAFRTLALGVLAGAFIALGAAFATTTAAGAEGSLPYGVTRMLMGVVFSLGLILVVVAGAELFTGNNLIVIAWAQRRIPLTRLLRNWGLVYVGNLAGALGTVALVYLARLHESGEGTVGAAALRIAQAKGELGFVQAIALGVLCNALVCLAVWLCLSARSVTDKVLAIVFPISAFVALGFEHSIANMYFLPLGILVREDAGDGFWSQSGVSPGDFPDVTLTDAIAGNLLPVTAGNIIGGSVMVGLVYWAVYLRRPGGR